MVPKALLEQWEAKLAADGLAPLDGPSFRRGATGEVLLAQGALVPRVRAEFWRRAETAAGLLPHGWPRGQFLRKAVQLGNVNRAARECRLTQKAGEWAWRKFLVFAGLPAPLLKGSPGRKRPTRPGLVRIEAGRFREERAA